MGIEVVEDLCRMQSRLLCLLWVGNAVTGDRRRWGFPMERILVLLKSPVSVRYVYSSSLPTFPNPNQCLIELWNFNFAEKKVTIKKRAKKKKLDSAGEKRERKKDREPCCRWLKGGSLFSNPFSTKKNSGTGGTPPPRPLSMWRRWSSCWWSYRKKILKEEENSGNVGTVAGLLDRFEWICEKKEEQALEEAFVPATPPKNALLLMRCRSAPHRSSALVAGDVVKETNQPPPADIAGNFKSERIHEENDIYPDNVSNGPSCGGSLKDEEDHDAASFSSRPLLLSRSNSGPAKLTNRVGLLDREDRGGLGGCKLQEGERSNERINECIDFESGAPCR